MSSQEWPSKVGVQSPPRCVWVFPKMKRRTVTNTLTGLTCLDALFYCFVNSWLPNERACQTVVSWVTQWPDLSSQAENIVVLCWCQVCHNNSLVLRRTSAVRRLWARWSLVYDLNLVFCGLQTFRGNLVTKILN